MDVRAAMRHGAPGCLIVAVLALSGCERKVDLQLAPDARKASEIAAVLNGQGIAVERKAEKSGVMLSVANADLARAMGVLREAGLLRAARPGADEALGKRSMAPTPTEERTRHTYARERELETTLMEIDGVVAARVSVVMPERPAPGAPLASASASVLVKHRADVDLSPLVPGIASLVKNGVPGLAAEDDRHVAVMLLPDQSMVPSQAGSLPDGSAGSMVRLTLLSGACMTIGYFADRLLRFTRQRRRNRSMDDGASAT